MKKESYCSSIAPTGQESIASLTDASFSEVTAPVASAKPSAFISNTSLQMLLHIPHPIQDSFTYAFIVLPPLTLLSAR